MKSNDGSLRTAKSKRSVNTSVPMFAFLHLQATNKGASLVVAGLITAVYELVMMLMSPLIGNHVRFFAFVL